MIAPPASPHVLAPLGTLAALAFLIATDGRPEVNRRVVRATLLGAGVMAAWIALAAWAVPRWLGPGPWWPDAALYDAQAARVAAAWRAGERPPLAAPEWLASSHTGYQRARAAWLLATGTAGEGATLALHALALAGALGAFVLVAARLHAGRPRRAARAVACFAAWPTHAVWAVSGLREVLLLAVFVAGAACALEARAAAGRPARRGVALAGTLAAFVWLATLRVHLAGAVAIVAAAVAAHRLRAARPRLLPAAIALALLLAAATSPWWLAPARAMAAAAADVAFGPGGLGPRGAADLLAAPVRLLLGPYPWVWLDARTADMLLYPGQWAACLLLLPAAGAALAPGRRRAGSPTLGLPRAGHPWRWPLVAVFAVYAVPLIAVYAGHAARAWYPAIVPLALLLPLGWPVLRRRPRGAALWALALGGGIALQVGARLLSFAR